MSTRAKHSAAYAILHALEDRGVQAPEGRLLDHIAVACVDAAAPAIREQLAEEIAQALDEFSHVAADIARKIGGIS